MYNIQQKLIPIFELNGSVYIVEIKIVFTSLSSWK